MCQTVDYLVNTLSGFVQYNISVLLSSYSYLSLSLPLCLEIPIVRGSHRYEVFFNTDNHIIYFV